MSCQQWTLATATFLLLIVSFWSFLNAILICTNKYLVNDAYLLMSHNHRDGSAIQFFKTPTTTTVTVVNTSLFVY